MMKMRTLWVAALVILLALMLASCGGGGQGGGGGSQTTAGKEATTAHTHNKTTTETTTTHKKAPPAGVVKSYSNLSRNHTKEPVDYPQTPPVGGPHNPIWQNCGFYSKPVRNEHAVHSMEHGAVWITYSPDLPKDQVAKIKSLTQKSYVLASPYPGLPAPLVASAWGKQLRLNSTNDPRLEQFVRAYRQGPQTPEPGAPCRGGVGSPE
jgi:predicted small secreted protein